MHVDTDNRVLVPEGSKGEMIDRFMVLPGGIPPSGLECSCIFIMLGIPMQCVYVHVDDRTFRYEELSLTQRHVFHRHLWYNSHRRVEA